MSSVCVHGLGYIGLPTAAMLATHGHQVDGYDTDPSVTASLRDGDVHFDQAGLESLVVRAVETGALRAVDDVTPAQYHVICVPTPFDEDRRESNLEYVAAAARAIRSVLREGDTVVLESTVPPGTTAKRVRPILEESGLRAGRDFGLAPRGTSSPNSERTTGSSAASTTAPRGRRSGSMSHSSGVKSGRRPAPRPRSS